MVNQRLQKTTATAATLNRYFGTKIKKKKTYRNCNFDENFDGVSKHGGVVKYVSNNPQYFF